MNPLIKNSLGVHWFNKPNDTYIATGVDRNGKRFKITSNKWLDIKCINIWRGTKWLVRDGRRYKLQSVYN